MHILRLKQTRIVVALLTVSILLFSQAQPVLGLSAAQKRAIAIGAKYFDVSVGCASADINGKIYVLGDSLTVGMRDQGELSSKLEAKGWSNVTIQATDGDGIPEALPKVEVDKTVISEASTVVIGLGTNREPEFEANLVSLVERIKSYNEEIKIYWVNVYTAPGAFIDGGEEENERVNQIINSQSTDLGFSVIRWKAEVSANVDAYGFLDDGVHHTPEGYVARTDFIVESVGVPPAVVSGASGRAGASNELIGDTVEEQIFNYMLGKEVHGKALTDFQVAGIMGNMWAESGYQPQRINGSPSGDITPADVARGINKAWGIVQWLPGSKMIDPTIAAGKDPNDLQVQLDFLIGQLNGTDLDGQSGERLVETIDVGAATLEFETGFERHGGPPQGDRVVEAQRILDLGFSGSGGVGGCNGGGGGGDIESTVIEYAWPTGDAAPQLELKPEYATATVAADEAGQYVGGPPDGVDCGAFVTRLLVNSGFEPAYNFGGVLADGAGNVSGGQAPWVRANWDRVTVSGTQDLKPGDVAIQSNLRHTFVFIGDVPGFNKQIASASLGERSPRAGGEDPLASNIEWYRQR